MNLNKFQQNLEAAGLGYDVYETIRIIDNNYEIVWHDNHPTTEESALAQDVLNSFDPADYVALRQETAKEQIKTIPEWGLITQTGLTDWWTDNVDDPISNITGFDQASLIAMRLAVTNIARAVYHGLQMILYIRDLIRDTRGQQPDN